MKIICALIILASNISFGQDTSIVKKQKGLLFLTDYNFQYDYKGAEANPVGFHDFFYPIKDFNVNLLSDTNINFVFKNGIRVDFIKGRKEIKSKANIVECRDTSRCYDSDKFYIVPVEIDYKYFVDNWPFICRRNYFEL